MLSIQISTKTAMASQTSMNPRQAQIPFLKKFLGGTVRLSAENDFEIFVTSELGKEYQLLKSSEPEGPWTADSDPFIAETASAIFPITQPPIIAFYKIAVTDTDSDSDA